MKIGGFFRMKKIKQLSVAILFVFMVLLPGLASANVAQTWDLKTDWIDGADNPNGVWSFLYGDDPLPWLSNWAGAQGAYALTTPPNNGHVPFWFQSITNAYDYQIGDIIMHPTSHDLTHSSPNYNPTSVTWTSPIDGRITISGNVWWGGWTGEARYTDWKLYLNNDLLDFGLGTVQK